MRFEYVCFFCNGGFWAHEEHLWPDEPERNGICGDCYERFRMDQRNAIVTSRHPDFKWPHFDPEDIPF
jgi:hypothetical protein